MTGVFEFLWGCTVGTILTATALGIKRVRDRLRWSCPDCGGNFVVEGSQEFIDYIRLEHGVVHE